METLKKAIGLQALDEDSTQSYNLLATLKNIFCNIECHFSSTVVIPDVRGKDICFFVKGAFAELGTSVQLKPLIAELGFTLAKMAPPPQ